MPRRHLIENLAVLQHEGPVTLIEFMSACGYAQKSSVRHHLRDWVAKGWAVRTMPTGRAWVYSISDAGRRHLDVSGAVAHAAAVIAEIWGEPRSRVFATLCRPRRSGPVGHNVYIDYDSDLVRQSMGAVEDCYIAHWLGVDRSSVGTARRRRGIAPYRITNRPRAQHEQPEHRPRTVAGLTQGD